MAPISIIKAGNAIKLRRPKITVKYFQISKVLYEFDAFNVFNKVLFSNIQIWWNLDDLHFSANSRTGVGKSNKLNRPNIMVDNFNIKFFSSRTKSNRRLQQSSFFQKTWRLDVIHLVSERARSKRRWQLAVNRTNETKIYTIEVKLRMNRIESKQMKLTQKWLNWLSSLWFIVTKLRHAASGVTTLWRRQIHFPLIRSDNSNCRHCRESPSVYKHRERRWLTDPIYSDVGRRVPKNPSASRRHLTGSSTE